MNEPNKPLLLIYEPAYERLRAELDGRVQPLVMDGAGVIHGSEDARDGGAAQPRIAWANRDLYSTGPVRDFMVTCLKSKALDWFQSSAAGFEHPVFAKLNDNGVRLTNSNASAVPIAEFVMAQAMTAFHPVQERLAAQRERRWQTFEFRDVSGSTWVVYGMGHVGAAIATRARAFGAEVLGVRRTPQGDEPVDRMVPPGALLEILPRADVVVLAAALNEHNRHVVNDAFLAALKNEVVLINIGRGGLIDEPALLRGLDAGRPALAIVDVFEQEPLADDSPFWGHPRVRLTAHCAGASPGTSARGDALFLTNLSHYLAGEPLELLVTHLETA